MKKQLQALAAQVGGPLLALDTSGQVTSVCLARADEVTEISLPAAALPAESLAQTLADLWTPDLRGIVVGLGPGSFTGLRVGLATVKGLALGSKIPVYGVSSLAAMAGPLGPGRVALALDARRGDIFAALYDVDAEGKCQALISDRVCTPHSFMEQLAAFEGPMVIAGDAAAMLNAPPKPADASAAHALLHAAPRVLQKQYDVLYSLTPTYLRVSEAERQLASGVLEKNTR